MSMSPEQPSRMAQHMAALHNTSTVRGTPEDSWRAPHVSQRLFSRLQAAQAADPPTDRDQTGQAVGMPLSTSSASPRRRQPSTESCPNPYLGRPVQGQPSARSCDGPSSGSSSGSIGAAPQPQQHFPGLSAPFSGAGSVSPPLPPDRLRPRHSRTISDPSSAPGGDLLFQALGTSGSGADEAPTPAVIGLSTPQGLRSSVAGGEAAGGSGGTLRLRHRGGGGQQPPLDRVGALLTHSSSSGWEQTTPPVASGQASGAQRPSLGASTGAMRLSEEAAGPSDEQLGPRPMADDVAAEEPGVVATVKESWLCPICLQTYDFPCTISLCGHNFCRSCLESLLRSSANQPNQRNDASRLPTAHCPLCRIDFSPEHVSCNRELLSEMKGVLIQCANRGCSLVYSPLFNKKHQDECDFSTAACPHQPHGCPFKAQRKDMEAHLRTCPFEQIKGFFPKLRASLDQTTAAMRGWENGFISQQQMLATHTALLRNFDRKSHHNPTDHLKLVHAVLWRPYCWPFEVERWSRSFSFSSAAMVFYLLPVMLAMLSIACRTSYRHFLLEMTLFHAAQAAPYPYPIIGVACQPDTGCLFGLSPKVTWVFLFLLLATSYVEAYDNTQWLGSFKLWTMPTPAATAAAGPMPPPSPNGAAPLDPLDGSTGSTTNRGSVGDGAGTTSANGNTASGSSGRRETLCLQVTRYVLCTCVAWTSYALGAAPLPFVRYLALACMLPLAFSIQLVARTCCKFQRPVIRGLIFGLMFRAFKWQDVAGSWVLVFLLCRGLAGVCNTQSGIIQLILSKLPVKLESLGPWTLWGHFPGSRILSPIFLALSGLLLYRFDGVSMLQCLAMQLAMEALSVVALFAVEKLLTRAMRAPRPGTPVPPERRGDVLCVLYTRAFMLLAVFGGTMLLSF